MADSANYVIRDAREDDCREIFEMKLLLIRHHGPDRKASITLEDLRRDGFSDRPLFRCLVCEETAASGAKQLVGYLLYFYFYDTVLGKIVWMEDLFVRDRCRRKGVALGLMKRISKIALEENSQALRWDWSVENKSALQFYERIGAVNLTDAGLQLNMLELDMSNMEKLSSSK